MLDCPVETEYNDDDDIQEAGSGPPFYLPARIATIENRLQKVETTQDHHTECFKVLFDHFKMMIPFPAPPPPAACSV